MAVSRPPTREHDAPREGGPRPGGPRGPKRQHRKVCAFCAEKIDYIDYKEISRLRRFISDRGKILPRRVTGTCAKHQRPLTTALERARSIALLPYTTELH
jgi:small subunit ribosomal protein S18